MAGGVPACVGFSTCGTVFKITPSGALTTLYSFDSTHGSHPYGSLVQGTDGNFYGTTSSGGGGSNDCSGLSDPCCGEVFKITPAGRLTVVHFQYSDGGIPLAGVIQGAVDNGVMLGVNS